VVRSTSTQAENRPCVGFEAGADGGTGVGTDASVGWGSTSLTWAWYRAAPGADES